MLQLADPELGVLLARRVEGRQVLLVQRDRVCGPAAELAESLCARERDSRAGRQRVRLRELVVGVRVLARLVQRRTLVEKRLGSGIVDRLVPGLGRAAQFRQVRLSVLLPRLLARGEVLLVERDRLLPPPAQTAQRLGAREDDSGPVDALAGAREEVVRVREVRGAV